MRRSTYLFSELLPTWPVLLARAAQSELPSPLTTCCGCLLQSYCYSCVCNNFASHRYFVSHSVRFVEILPSNGAVQRMCADFKVAMLPSIPMDPALVQACEQGQHLATAVGVAATGAALALHQLTTTVMLVLLPLLPNNCSVVTRF